MGGETPKKNEDNDTLVVAKNCVYMIWYQMANLNVLYALLKDIGHELEGDDLRQTFMKGFMGLDERVDSLENGLYALTDYVEAIEKKHRTVKKTDENHGSVVSFLKHKEEVE